MTAIRWFPLRVLVFCFLPIAFTVPKTAATFHRGKPAQQVLPQRSPVSPSWRPERITASENMARKVGADTKAMQHQTRQVRLREYCRTNDHRLGLPRLYRFQVIESPKIVFCMVPKVASRQWRSLLQNIRLQKRQLRTNLEHYRAENICDYLRKSFKFMFVREPFERLLSAYKDKFVLTRAADRHMLETYGRNIIKKFRPNATQRALKTGDDVSFPEFIEYLIKDGVREGLNWHWNTYDDQCRPCSVAYDYIGRYENLAKDAEVILKKAGVYNLVKFPRIRYSKTKTELLQYYSQVPLDWIVQLGQIYRNSFEMFGYPFPGPLQSLFINATVLP